MSSRSETPLSMEQLKAMAKANTAAAVDTPTMVALSDKNWSALNANVSLLGEMEVQAMNMIRQLTTSRQMDEKLAEQAELLQQDLTGTQATIEDLLTKIQAEQNSQSDMILAQTQKSISEISSQAGRAKDSFSSACLEMKDDMKRWLKKVMWIALIPSGLVFVLELLHLILSAVLHG